MRSRVSAEAGRSVGNVRVWRLCFSLLLSAALVSCGGEGKPATPPRPALPYLGAVVSPEPIAGQIARQVLAEGGDAADAAVTLGFALAVSLPSRAGLGGGGACLAYAPSRSAPGSGRPEAILFLPASPLPGGQGGDRPAAVPMLARGLYLLHARYGRLPIEQLVGEAQKMARLGVRVSPRLADDIAAVAGPLLADPAARAVFTNPSGSPLAVGDGLFQPDLANTLSELRLDGLSNFYQGSLAQRLAEAATAAGGGLTEADFARAIPSLATPIELRAGVNRVAFLPAPADGGLAAAAAFAELQKNPADLAGAAERALAVATRWRAGGVSGEAVLAAPTLPPATLPPLPASTAFATLDNSGGAVACAVTMNNLFGTGRIAPGTGVLLAAAPGTGPLPLLAASIAWNNNIHAFRAAVAGSGQNQAAIATALGMAGALSSRTLEPLQLPEPGAAQVISCGRFLPGNTGTCSAAVFPPSSGGSAFSGTYGLPARGS